MINIKNLQKYAGQGQVLSFEEATSISTIKLKLITEEDLVAYSLKAAYLYIYELENKK